MKNYLLMTATVCPPIGEHGTKRIDVSIRLNDYMEAFNFYLSEQITTIDGILFVDNSNHALTEIKHIAQNYKGSKQLEILSFYGLDYPIEFNKGYGELKLIEYAFDHSQLIKSMTEDDHFWKVTGRLKVLTINKIINTAPKTFNIYADFRRRRGHVDTRLIAFSLNGYKKHVYGKSKEMLGSIIETWLFKKLIPLLGEKETEGIVPEFRVVAKYEGVASGFMNVNYMAPKQRLIYFIRSIYLSTKYFLMT
jgi:hypothetical protein